jgi:hypothetical protein
VKHGRWLALGVVALAGVALIAFAAIRPTGPDGYLRGHYRAVSADGSSQVFHSDAPPRTVYDEVRRSARPAQTFTDPGGYFLRYRNRIVAVTSEGTGSRIWLDDDRRGYARWYSYVGGYWGTNSGAAESVHGGGPGAGK